MKESSAKGGNYPHGDSRLQPYSLVTQNINL